MNRPHHRYPSRVVTAVMLAMALLCAACSSDGNSLGSSTDSSPTTTPSTPESSSPPAEDTTDTSVDDAGALVVQDLWIYDQVATIDAQGNLVDLTSLIVAELDDGTAESVDLGDGLVFHRHNAMGARLVDGEQQIRGDVAVEVGLFQAPGVRNIAVIATPEPGANPIGAEDHVQLDLTFLDDVLEPGDPLFIDVAFIQAYGDGSSEENLNGADLLGLRLGSGRVNVVGFAGDDGGFLAYSSEIGGTVAGSIWSDLPAKSHGMRDGFRKGLQGCRFGLRCVRNYFRHMTDAVVDFGSAFDCNLGVGPCLPLPPTPDPDTQPDTTRPQPNPNPNSTVPVSHTPRSALVHGDPHLRTFDGVNYSMQAVGEFVAATTHDIEIQIRTAPIEGRTDLSFLSGAAVAVTNPNGGHDTVSMTGDALHINGQPLELSELGAPLELGDARITLRGNGIELTTGSGATIVMTRGWGTTMELWAEIGAAGEVESAGLWGNNDGERDNDLQSRTGEAFDPDDFDEFYGVYVESWRLSDAQSHFFYGPGESTDTFTDRSLPRAQVSIDSLSASDRARATAVCERAGIVDPITMNNCILDFGMSGMIGFVLSAVTADTVIGINEGRLLADGSDAATVAEMDLGFGPDDGHGPDDDEIETLDEDIPVVIAEWAQTATDVREGNETFTRVVCPAAGTEFVVWGTDIYSDDSSVCTAAVHIGLLSFTEGGEVLIQHWEGLGFYRGSTRHGVTTRDWDSWPGSFVFIGARGIPIEGEES